MVFFFILLSHFIVFFGNFVLMADGGQLQQVLKVTTVLLS